MQWVKRADQGIFRSTECAPFATHCYGGRCDELSGRHRACRARQLFTDELVGAGHRFFGGVSRGLATVIEKAVSRWGCRTDTSLGRKVAVRSWGLRFGEGTLFTKNAGDLKVYWQGPSVGWDFGGDGARTMMLVYNLPATEAIYERFAGVEGSAYFIGGFGMTAPHGQQRRRGSDLIRRRIPSRRQRRLPQVHPQATWNPF